MKEGCHGFYKNGNVFAFRSGASYDVWTSNSWSLLTNFDWESILSPEVGHYWNLALSGKTLRLSVDSAAVPEPGTFSMILAGLVFPEKTR
ncbi:MAG: hypothetical protein Q4D98_13680 [Planctomycetia bacterium]|nr:hypothetical protein [Planctomycetia bacterium]